MFYEENKNPCRLTIDEVLTGVLTRVLTGVLTEVLTGLDRFQNMLTFMQHTRSLATQEFEDLRDLEASQELILCFSATPENAGNLPIKKKATHINPETPGAPEVTKLERERSFCTA